MPLVVENLTVVRGGRSVLTGLGFTAAPGETVTLTGHNGVGKSTLLRAIAGYIAPEQGSVRFVEVGSADDPSTAERAHFIGHLDGVKAALTVIENARFWGTYLGGDAALVTSVLERVGLAGLALVGTRFLSAGQKRRLALGRLLLASRPLWLLDEPTASLDTAGQMMLADMAGEHLDAGGIIVAATHVPLGFPNTRELQLGAVGSA